ncbi:MAG: TonB C-terminal domain-containing protein [bacterium]|nr:TonB C-terminal domain-containing protein [bacterium]MCP5068040.1 TonB C-terminal domain-containing protein [bacterium]
MRRVVRIATGACMLIAMQGMVGCMTAPIPSSMVCPTFERPPLPLDAMPGVGSCAGSSAAAAWVDELRRSISKEWHPPRGASAMGEVQAVFVLARDGSVRDSCIQSGQDRAAVTAVVEALHAHRLERPPPPEAACLIGIRLLAKFKVTRR